MGGCCSTSRKDSDEPTEQTSLLHGNGTTYTEPTDSQGGHYDRMPKAQEEAMLKTIVQRVADNLIDVSNIHAADRLDESEVQKRSLQYGEILKTIPLSKAASSRVQKPSSSSRNVTPGSFKTSHSAGSYAAIAKSYTPPEVAFDMFTLSQEDIELMKQASEDLKEAYDGGFQIQDCGKVVKGFSLE